ncbi:MAG TPA: hypothetical protein VFB19_15385 [Mycobacterium sp.]|nr:hypothetical protein [Mycobacterium sp.]
MAMNGTHKAFVAIGAIAGAVIVTAPGANAVTEGQIQSTCEGQGGYYSSHVMENGNRVSQCCYPIAQPNPNKWQCDYYVNGEFDGGQSFKGNPPTTMTRQPRPPGPTPTIVNPGPG